MYVSNVECRMHSTALIRFAELLGQICKLAEWLTGAIFASRSWSYRPTPMSQIAPEAGRRTTGPMLEHQDLVPQEDTRDADPATEVMFFWQVLHDSLRKSSI